MRRDNSASVTFGHIYCYCRLYVACSTSLSKRRHRSARRILTKQWSEWYLHFEVDVLFRSLTSCIKLRSNFWKSRSAHPSTDQNVDKGSSCQHFCLCLIQHSETFSKLLFSFNAGMKSAHEIFEDHFISRCEKNSQD